MNPSEASPNPEDYPHHYIVRKKGGTGAPRVRAFHLTEKCRSLENTKSDHEIIDAPLEVIKFFGMQPCSTCLRDTNAVDSIGVVTNVVDAVISHVGAQGSVTTDEAVDLLLAELLDKGYKIARNRKAPDRSEVSPLAAWLEEHGISATGQDESVEDVDDAGGSGLDQTDDSLTAELAAHLEGRHSFIVTNQTGEELAASHVSFHDSGQADHDLFDLAPS